MSVVDGDDDMMMIIQSVFNDGRVPDLNTDIKQLGCTLLRSEPEGPPPLPVFLSLSFCLLIA